MRPIVLIGVLLVVIGAAALLFGHFEYSDTRPVLKTGPLQVNATEQHSVAIPTIAGIVILIAGVGLVIAGSAGRLKVRFGAGRPQSALPAGMRGDIVHTGAHWEITSCRWV